ncbi:unnamed protein product, partial [Didymodactylos carnosus]
LWNTTGTIVAGQGGQGNGPSQLNEPVGLFLTSTSTLYIAEYANHRVQRCYQGSSSCTTVAGSSSAISGSSQSSLYRPLNMYVTTNETIYISDYGNNRVQKWDSAASSGTTFTTASNLRFIWSDQSVTYLYVTDATNTVVRQYLINGATSQIVAGQTGGGGQMAFPYGVYFDSLSNQLYVSDQSKHVVIKFNSGNVTGEFIAGTAGTSGAQANQLNGPTGLRLDQYGNLYVADRYNSRIQLFCNGSTNGIT